MNIPIKDIKPNVALVDYQWYVFLLFLVLVSLLTLFILYRIYRRFKKPNPKKILLEKLKNLDFSDPKEVAYGFAPTARPLLNEKNKELFNEIEKLLQTYKYKPDVPEINDETKSKIQEFIRLCDEF